MVSDNATNIKGAINHLQLKHWVLYSQLNLIVQEALKTQLNLINIVKTIVGHFKQNSNANHQLMLYQENSGNTKKTTTRCSYALEFHIPHADYIC